MAQSSPFFDSTALSTNFGNSLESLDLLSQDTEGEDIFIDLGGDEDEEESVVPAPDHWDNLAEWMDEESLDELADELVELVHEDRESRQEWAEQYVKGLKLLGYVQEERNEPWPGACGAIHPLLSESVTKFVAHAITDLFPAQGPAVAKTYGKSNPEQDAKGDRVQTYLNYLLLEEMSEYRTDHEQALYFAAQCGSAFKKVYFDETLGRPTSRFIPCEDFVVNFYTTDLHTAERYTHIMRRSPNQLKKLMVQGFYRDVYDKIFPKKEGEDDSPLPDQAEAPDETEGEIKEKYQEIQGFERLNVSGQVTLFEIYCELDLKEFPDVDQNGEETGIALPYIVTVELESGKILAIRRNFLENDSLKRPIQHIIHYKFHPSTGFYGAGYVQLIGGLANAATSMLRQLVDAGTVANLPGGYKSRDLRVKNENKPIKPGEWRDAEVTGSTIKDSFFPLPYKEPSPTLSNLLGELIKEGKEFASIADMPVNQEGRNEIPATTALAMIERSMKVMSAVMARMHSAQKRELRMLSRIVKDYLGQGYQLPQFPGLQVMPEDFDAVDVVPVSNPDATGQAQKLMRAQAMMQAAQNAPQIYNQRELHRNVLDAMGAENVDQLVPPEKEIPPADPVTENAKTLKNEPIQVYEWQDHDAHIAAHQSFMQDPQIQNSPMAQQIMPMIAAHVSEHLAYKYRQEVAQAAGVQMPPMNQPMNPQIEGQIASRVSQAAGQVTGKHQQEAQMQEQMEQMQDPVTQQRMMETKIKLLDTLEKVKDNERQAEIDRMKAEMKDELDRMKLASDERQNAADIAKDIQLARLQETGRQQTEAWKTFYNPPTGNAGGQGDSGENS